MTASPIALLGTLLLAKALAVVAVPPTGPFAWLCLPGDDLLLAAWFAVLAGAVPRGVAVGLYVLLVGYAALNVALVHAIGTPLVAAMLRGADAAMGDSIGHYLQPSRLWPAIVVAAAGAALPAFVGGVAGLRRPWSAALLATAVWWLLPLAGHPAQRNAVFALAGSLLPRTPPAVDVPSPAAASGSPFAAWRGAATGRSVVFVVLESAAPRFLRPWGGSADPMPFLTGLAPRSLVADAAYCVYPESILGQLPIWCSTSPLPDSEPEQYRGLPTPSLPELLHRRGYRSGLFHSGRFRFLGMDHVLAAVGFQTLADAATIGGVTESSFGIDEESTVAATLRWIDTLPQDQPFLAAWLPIAGHHPYDSPGGGPFPTDSPTGCYQNALHWCDRNLRALWQGVCARRPAQDLLLCVVGDHGQAFGEHDGNFGHTFALYEENVRVPWLLHAPGLTEVGARVAVPCSHLDVAPTLADLLGVDADAAWQGRSLLQDASPRPVRFFTDWGDLQVGHRLGDRKVIHCVTTGRASVFLLDTDPGERRPTEAEATAAAAWERSPGPPPRARGGR